MRFSVVVLAVVCALVVGSSAQRRGGRGRGRGGPPGRGRGGGGRGGPKGPKGSWGEVTLASSWERDFVGDGARVATEMGKVVEKPVLDENTGAETGDIDTMVFVFTKFDSRPEEGQSDIRPSGTAYFFPASGGSTKVTKIGPVCIVQETTETVASLTLTLTTRNETTVDDQNDDLSFLELNLVPEGEEQSQGGRRGGPRGPRVLSEELSEEEKAAVPGWFCGGKKAVVTVLSGASPVPEGKEVSRVSQLGGTMVLFVPERPEGTSGPPPTRGGGRRGGPRGGRGGPRGGRGGRRG